MAGRGSESRKDGTGDPRSEPGSRSSTMKRDPSGLMFYPFEGGHVYRTYKTRVSSLVLFGQ